MRSCDARRAAMRRARRRVPARRAPGLEAVGGDILEYRDSKLRTVAEAGIFDQAAADRVVSDRISAWGLAEEPILKKFVLA